MPMAEDYQKTSTAFGLQAGNGHPDKAKYRQIGRYKSPYEVNEINIQGAGDILISFTDGLIDPIDGAYTQEMLESVVAENKHLCSRGVCEKIIEDRQKYKTDDDLTVLVKKFQ
jgi:serine phosphatase RsbU (regulator of sigma subunit)